MTHKLTITFQRPAFLSASSDLLTFKLEATDQQIAALLKFSHKLFESRTSITTNEFLEEDITYIEEVINKLKEKFIYKTANENLSEKNIIKLIIAFLEGLRIFTKSNKKSFPDLRKYQYYFTEGYIIDPAYDFAIKYDNKTFYPPINNGFHLATFLKIKRILDSNKQKGVTEFTISETIIGKEAFDYIALLMGQLGGFFQSAIKQEKSALAKLDNTRIALLQKDTFAQIINKASNVVKKEKIEIIGYDQIQEIIPERIVNLQELAQDNIHKLFSPLLEECIQNFPKDDICDNQKTMSYIALREKFVTSTNQTPKGNWSTWNVQLPEKSVIGCCLLCNNIEIAKLISAAFKKSYIAEKDDNSIITTKFGEKYLFISTLPYWKLYQIKEELIKNLENAATQLKESASLPEQLKEEETKSFSP